MKRQRLTDGGWFDREAAKRYNEDTYHDGQNFISRATGTQWDHESLYRTRRGRWVLHWWSQWQGSRESWIEISADEAHRWLIKQGHSGAVPAPALQAAEV